MRCLSCSTCPQKFCSTAPETSIKSIVETLNHIDTCLTDDVLRLLKKSATCEGLGTENSESVQTISKDSNAPLVTTLELLDIPSEFEELPEGIACYITGISGTILSSSQLIDYLKINIGVGLSGTGVIDLLKFTYRFSPNKYVDGQFSFDFPSGLLITPLKNESIIINAEVDSPNDEIDLIINVLSIIRE